MDRVAWETAHPASAWRVFAPAGMDYSVRAISRVSATTPEIVRRLNRTRKSLPYADQIKPSNFVLASYVKPMDHPAGVDPEKFQLIASYEPDPRKWLRAKWINRYDGTGHSITTHDDCGDSGVARVKSYRDVLDEYAAHPEPKSADLAGNRVVAIRLVCSGAARFKPDQSTMSARSLLFRRC